MPKKTTKGLTDRITSFLASALCFRLIVAFFVLEALWIALSCVYPMAFDEQSHLGIIRLYAEHPSPFWTSPPAGVDALGPVSRDPSYLYQWLMSFPYRLVAAFTDSQMMQVIFLRLINIGLFAAALPLYRRLLLQTGASRAAAHFCLALFVLIPVAPLLAAQINYDNLFIPLTAACLLLVIRFSNELLGGRFNIKMLLWLTVAVILTSMVKYAFLPIALVLAAYLVVRLWQSYRGRTDKLWSDIKAGWRLASRGSRWLVIASLLVSLGLFTERYVANLARYHQPVPRCDQVLTVEQCKAYGPWSRNHSYAQVKPADAPTSPLTFSADWFYGMWFRTFFTLAGPEVGYQTRGPLILPALGAVLFSVVALLMTLTSFKQVLHKYNHRIIWLYIFIISTYVLALWFNGYQSFLQTGRAVALNGRYLLPVFPLLMIVLTLGVGVCLQSHTRLKAAFAGLALICMLWGGGTLTYILRSNDTWYWSGSPLTGANHAIQEIIGPVTPGNNTPRIFMGRNST